MNLPATVYFLTTDGGAGNVDVYTLDAQCACEATSCSIVSVSPDRRIWVAGTYLSSCDIPTVSFFFRLFRFCVFLLLLPLLIVMMMMNVRNVRKW